MRVLLATGIYPPTPGGPATYAKLLHDELPQRGIEVAVVSFDTVRNLPTGVRHLVYLCKLFWAARHVDIIYAQDPVSVGFPARIVARLRSKKLLLKVVGDYAWEQGVQRFGVTDLLDTFVERKVTYHSRVERLMKIERSVARAADAIIVPSEYLKRIVTAWGISSEKITVVYNTFEAETVATSKEELRTRFGYTSPTLVTVGRLVPWKGIGTLVALMPKLRQKFPNLQLEIIGSGPQKAEIERIRTEGKLESCVTLHGALSHTEVLERLKAADVFVLNTGYEGFSHLLLEALSVGVPVVTTDAGGNPEIITDKENGLLVSYNNQKELEQAIEHMLLDTTLQHNVSATGLQIVSNYTKERLINETIQVLKRV